MTEDEARDWLGTRVPRGTMALLERFVALVQENAQQQNLIAASTQDAVWARHIVDSAQLLAVAPPVGRWIDLGSGAGFPGMVVGLVSTYIVTLVEPRAKRAAFLRDVIERLALSAKVQVRACRAESLPSEPFDVISARALAPLDRLLPTAIHLSGADTVWILPKGRSAQAELDAARRSWQGRFRIVPSVTDPQAAIIVADRVRPAQSGRKAGSLR